MADFEKLLATVDRKFALQPTRRRVGGDYGNFAAKFAEPTTKMAPGEQNVVVGQMREATPQELVAGIVTFLEKANA